MSPSGRDRNQSHGQADTEGKESVPILASSSYNWMVNTLSFFLREVWILIQGDALHHMKGPAVADADTGRKMDAFSYSRADLCEVCHIYGHTLFQNPLFCRAVLRSIYYFVRTQACIIKHDLNNFLLSKHFYHPFFLS